MKHSIDIPLGTAPEVYQLFSYANPAPGSSISPRRERYVSPVLLAQVLVGLDDHDAAIGRLEQAYEQRSSDLAWLAVRPAFAPVRADQRVTELLVKLGLIAAE